MKNLFWIAVSAVIVVAVVAGVVSYDHLHTVAIAAGEEPWIARLVPLSADGLLVSASLSAFIAKRQDRQVHGMTKFSLAVGLTASVAANIASPFVGGLTGTSQDILAAVVGAWPALALALSFEEVLRLTASGQAVPASQEARRSDEIPSEGKDTRETLSTPEIVSPEPLPETAGVEAPATPEVPVTAEAMPEKPTVSVEVISLPEVRKRAAVSGSVNTSEETADAQKSARGGASVKAEALAYLAMNPATSAADLAVKFGRSDRWGRMIRKDFHESLPVAA